MSILSAVIENTAGAAQDAKAVAQKVAEMAADGVTMLSQLSPKQVEEREAYRRAYLKGESESEKKEKDTIARCLQSIAIEITQTYLTRLNTLYLPVAWKKDSFIPKNRIRYFDVTKWVVDSSEKSLDKLTNLYQVLSKENCTIALIYTRRTDGCTVTLAVTNTEGSDQAPIANGLCERFRQALMGNFSGAELECDQAGTPPALENASPEDTVVAVSNLASERSKDFISQSIEKLLDGVAPKSREEEYTVVLLAQPSSALEARRDRLYELYSTLSPYATWQKSNSINDSLTNTASASVGLQLGAHWGQQVGASGGVNFVGSANVNVGLNSGFAIGGSFQRAAMSGQTIGKVKGWTRSYTNYGVKHMLELLERQVKRQEECMALGMWEFATYVISHDYNTASNVAHMYLSLTQGENSYLEQAAVNVWSPQVQGRAVVEAILPWLQALQHPEFALSPEQVTKTPDLQVFPTLTTASASISGDELAHALNFPRRSVGGLPVYECVPFGREVVQYSHGSKKPSIPLGRIYHMRREESAAVSLDRDSLTAHTFITGSTGAGKSNAVYTLLNELCLGEEKDARFLVIEPAKGEYKEVLGGYPGVSVYGTNPRKTQLLQLNPFSFPEETHVLEHIDRLIEIFNACWPMYAAMPAVLKASVEQAYKGCGWSLNSSTCSRERRTFPTFRDVMRALPTVVDSKGFSNDTQGDYKGALLTRLESLTNGINGQVLCAHNELPSSELFDKNVIVDLSRVGSTETKSLLMGILILKLQEHRMFQREARENCPNSGLKHITVLEEAHTLLRRTSIEQSQEGSNLQGKSVEMLTNAIAEMRTYGEGFIIADQSPGLLDMAVIRNTNTKIILRLPDESDRMLVGNAAGLNEDQIVELSRLDTGVAAVYQNHWLEPVLCKVSVFDKPEKFAYSPPDTSSVSLADHIFDMLLKNSPDDTSQETEDIDQIKTWIDRQETGHEAKKLLHQMLVDRQPLSESEKEYSLYCLTKGKHLVEEIRRSTVSTEGAQALADQQIMESLLVSERLAQEIRQIVLIYAADSIRGVDEQQYYELRQIGGVQ